MKSEWKFRVNWSWLSWMIGFDIIWRDLALAPEWGMHRARGVLLIFGPLCLSICRRWQIKKGTVQVSLEELKAKIQEIKDTQVKGA